MIGAAAALVLALPGCSTGPQRHPEAAGAGQPPAARVTKLLVVVMENHSLPQMRSAMPYTFAQAQRYGYATDYRAIRHPSLPNYLAMVSGGTRAVTDDHAPSVHRLSGPTVFAQAIRAGRSARVYAEGMPGNCSVHDGGNRYAVRHNPWAYFTDERQLCRHDDVPISRLGADVRNGSLPNAGLIIPDTCHDAHDCGLGTADAWFATTMQQIYAGKDWKSGQLAVVLTADEDDRHSDNRVLTVVMYPGEQHRVVTSRLTHYSLTGLYDDVLGVPRLTAAPSMAAAFQLPVG